MPIFFTVMRFVVDPLWPLCLYIFMLKHCAFIYYNCMLCGVSLMFKISFPDFRMPPKKRKMRDISHETKGVGRLCLEEHWSFVGEQLTSDFILTQFVSFNNTYI